MTTRKRAAKDPIALVQAKPPRTRTISSDAHSMLNQLLGMKPANVSQRVENISRRLFLLTTLHVPLMTAGEWAVVVIALKQGVGLDDMNCGSNVLAWAHVYGAAAQDVYQVDALEVSRKLIDAGPSANVAVAEMVERYWQFQDVEHADRLEMLKLIDREAVRLWKADAQRRDEAIKAGQSSAKALLD